jgi:hypothetical protein
MLAAPAAAAPRWQRIATTGPAPSGRYHHALAATGDSVVLFGGESKGRALGDTWVFDLTRGRWRQLAIDGESPPPRWGLAMAARRDGTIVLFGGQSEHGFLGDSWTLDLATRRWTRIAAGGPKARYGAASALDPVAQTLLVSHGFTDNGRFDDTWRIGAPPTQLATVNPLPEPRCLVRGGVIRGGFYIFGGQSTPTPFLGDLWRLDLATGRWRELTPARRPSPRNLYAAAVVGRRWILHGGLTAKGVTGELWSYGTVSGRFARLSQPRRRPGARQAHYAVATRTGIVVFGGLSTDGAELADTWRLRL